MNYDKLCKDIFEIDNSVRFANVYNKHGEVVSGGMHKDKESLLNSEEASMSLYYSKQMFEKHTNLYHRLGKERYSMTEYQNVKMVTISLRDNNLLLISIEPKSDHCKMITNMLKVVDNLQAS